MYIKIKSCNITKRGLDLITIEALSYKGIPSVRITGLADTLVKESFYRVSAALKSNGIELPAKKIIINIYPANLPKTGTGIDLAIITILLAMSKTISAEALQKHLLIGELDLKGNLQYTPSILATLELAKKNKLIPVIPYQNIKNTIFCDKFIAIKHIQDLIRYANTGSVPYKQERNTPMLKQNSTSDFNEVLDQAVAVRAALIAATGKYNILFIGPPGVGKTMIAERMLGIMPELQKQELIEVSSIYSIAQEDDKIILNRPFRSPHHTASVSGMLGGNRIGEVSLAHKGILFLDEFSEYNTQVLNALREPLEKKKVHISRVNYKYTIPADFMLVASANPCPCGNYLSKQKQCTCTYTDISHFRKKLNGPLLDRFDLKVVMDSPLVKRQKPAESTKVLKEKLLVAQKYLKHKESFSRQAQHLLSAVRKDLNYRSYKKLLNISKTIAALDRRTEIKDTDILEAKIYLVNPYENKR